MRLGNDVGAGDLLDACVHLLGPSFVLVIAWLAHATARDAMRAAAFEHAALTDALTDLPNRRRFDRELAREIAKAHEFGSPLQLVIVDVDRFKETNDRYGHAAGDRVLREVARLIGQSARHDDLACRIGGDEFAILLPGLDGDQAFVAVERLRGCVENTTVPSPDGASIRVTVSLGAAALMAGDMGETLLSRADRALYAAKRAGRNRANLAA